jgi:cell division protein FtsI/penicillin-binding protein 2
VQGAALVAVLIAVLGTVAGCGSKPSPGDAAGRFLAGVSRGYYATADRLAGQPSGTVDAAYHAFLTGLRARRVGYTLGTVTTAASGDTADAAYTARVTPGGYGRMTYHGRFALRLLGKAWQVRWAPTIVHPELTAGRTIGLTTAFAERAPILGAGAQRLVTSTPVVTVGVHPKLLTNRTTELATLARIVGVDLAGLRRSVAAARPDSFVPVITLRRPAFEAVKPKLDALKGVPYLAGTAPLAPTATFARAILGRVGSPDKATLAKLGAPYTAADRVGLYGLEAAYERRLAGTPTARVVVRDAKGATVETLATYQGRAPAAVTTTIDRRVQAAAEAALGDPATARHVSFVAVRASDGHLLAVANRPGDSSYDAALVGRYPPGSTFKVVTTTALLAKGLRTTDPVPCPGSITVNGKTFSNFQGESAPGDVPFRTDFAMSCNTAFVRLSSRLGAGDLRAAAARYAVGGTWTLPVPVFAGSVPLAGDPVERAADAIGQGKVLVSPLAMAMIAASVASGSWHPPQLVTDPAPASAPAARPLPAGIVTSLRSLMRAVVTSGTARQAFAGLRGPPVYGKTGTAEFGSDNPPRTHAWFIGYRGDIAFAVIVEGGGVGGQVAAPIAARFLRALGSS